MTRMLILLFSVLSYGIFLLVFLYLVAFLGNLQATALADSLPILKSLVPYSIDYGRESGSYGTAFAINLGLIASELVVQVDSFFGLQDVRRNTSLLEHLEGFVLHLESFVHAL